MAGNNSGSWRRVCARPGRANEACEDVMMAQASDNIDVYLELGKKRTFAGAIGWPGWCRIGRDEGSALQALADYGPR